MIPAMNRPCLVLLGVACAIVVVGAFLPWITFRIGGELPAEAAAALRVDGWHGTVKLFGVSSPTWVVPAAAIAVALLAWLRATRIWESPRGLAILIAAASTGLVVTVLVVGAGNHEAARVGFGALLAAFGSACALGLTAFARDADGAPTRSRQPHAPRPPVAPQRAPAQQPDFSPRPTSRQSPGGSFDAARARSVAAAPPKAGSAPSPQRPR